MKTKKISERYKSRCFYESLNTKARVRCEIGLEEEPILT